MNSILFQGLTPTSASCPTNRQSSDKVFFCLQNSIPFYTIHSSFVTKLIQTKYDFFHDTFLERVKHVLE